jgi:cell division protein FtsI (penicillin-binding protein 3)
VFAYSSNIGAAMMGQALGEAELKDFYGKLGLLKKAPIEVQEVGTPLVPNPWRDSNTATAAFGQGISVTPLQLVSAACSIVDGGTKVMPTLIAGDGSVQSGERVVSAATAQKMRELLRLVVTDGTGKYAMVPGYNVGGKTGTAEKPGVNGGYDHTRQIASFLGFFPMDNPHYAVYIMVDEPKNTGKDYGHAHGGQVAAPAVARVIANMASVLAIAPQSISPDKDLAAPLRQYVHDREESPQPTATGTGGRQLVSY